MKVFTFTEITTETKTRQLEGIVITETKTTTETYLFTVENGKIMFGNKEASEYNITNKLHEFLLENHFESYSQYCEQEIINAFLESREEL